MHDGKAYADRHVAQVDLVLEVEEEHVGEVGAEEDEAAAHGSHVRAVEERRDEERNERRRHRVRREIEEEQRLTRVHQNAAQLELGVQYMIMNL